MLWAGNHPGRPSYPDDFPDVVASADDPDVPGDPARYLLQGDTLLTRARIRGIRSEAAIRVWLGVANSLRQRGRLDDPGYWNVVGHLQDQKELLDQQPAEDPYRRPIHLDVIRQKRERDQQGPSTSATRKIQQLRTDGGEDDEECFRCGQTAPAEDLQEFELPNEETVLLHPDCRERWNGRIFILGGEPA